MTFDNGGLYSCSDLELRSGVEIAEKNLNDGYTGYE